MDLRTVLSAVLPLASREQILGDLEERGFRARDILSVLPGAWLAHLRREWLGPVPSLADASEAALRLRAEQLRRAASVDLLLLMWGQPRLCASRQPGLSAPDFDWLHTRLGHPISHRDRYPMESLMPSPSQLLGDYRSTLQRRTPGVSAILLMGSLPRLLNQQSPIAWKLFFEVSTILLAGVLLYRSRHIIQELRNLNHPPRALTA
ncbi:MAG: hypothetical protein ABIR70_01085 [Bryobacteraceae bacterium]